MPARLLHYSDVENAFDDPERIGRLAGLLTDLDGDDAVVVGSGDNTAPGVLSLVTEGRHSLPFFEAVGAEFDTFGNHDFDYGPDATRALVADSPQTWLTANVHETDCTAYDGATDGGDAPAGTADAPYFAAEHTEPWVVRDVDGVRVGFFGVTTPATNSINPNATDVGFADPISAGVRAAEACRDAGAEYVVAVSHLGTDDDDLAVAADVDVVLGGHVHSEVVERVNGAVLLRPGVNGHVAYEVELAELGDDGDGKRVDVTRHVAADAPVHEGVAEAMRDQMRAADLDEVVAHVADPIERSHTAAFRGESRIGNFVADAYRWATGADVGLQNSGGVREGDPLEGEVTIADVMSVVPFQEPVATAELTGAELRETVRQASGANLAFGEPDWWHAHLSGASVVWDRERDEIVALRVDGEPVDDDATYTLATTDYLFHTDHEFPALDADHRLDVGDVQYEVLAAYARENGLDPRLEGRVAWSD
ncbi:bifunctional metallophosphatase/5'-nucleotidase [Halorubellus sp. JP-L1]|uniref:bifunctional metallophosphatase/5'-nucleotidase n=1 Tax=Halorubellus sp. JP-L1 TaxID=2715753 RepID=UPI00140BA036|nr:bifunctional metallophosphatase/5'-nucleotidase [Halorubellus sp. JP-L1]NHN40640.1 bifunctional metallophosphatase/5'-nucleotidase [Halorubellus sp. JP-L1]